MNDMTITTTKIEKSRHVGNTSNNKNHVCMQYCNKKEDYQRPIQQRRRCSLQRKRSVQSSKQLPVVSPLQPEERRQHYNFIPLICVIILTSSSLTSASTDNNVMTHSSPSSLAWIATRNQRRVSYPSSRTACRLSAQTNNDRSITAKRKSSVRREWTMITDSRELRFLEGCNAGTRSYASSRSSSPSTSSPLLLNHHDENTQRKERTESSDSSTTSESYTKSTMSVLEEMIAMSYYHAIESNHEMVSSVFRPLLDTIHNNPNYHLSKPKQLAQSNEATAVMTTEPSVGLFSDRFASIKSRERSAPTSTFTRQHEPPNPGSRFFSTLSRTDNFSTSSLNGGKDVSQNRLQQNLPELPKRSGYGSSIQLTDDERELFQLLRRVRKETHLETTLRVAGGWVRDKLLATPEFQAYHKVYSVGKESLSSPKGGNRLTSKFHRHKQPAPSMGRQGTKILTTSDRDVALECQPVDIDIALDDMLGREFADHLNEYLVMKGEETVSVGMVLKNPEKSKHLETATMKVNAFWIDFVNLRAEEYTQDSRIPDLMRIGTAREDAYRRDLTINSLFYNVNTGEIEDWTGRGFDDLRKGVIATPLPPLTTLLDDPLRVLRSIRFAARLRFTMDNELVHAAKDSRVASALSLKVSRERVGGELDLMLRSPDPVGAVRLLINLNLIDCVFPLASYLPPAAKSADTIVPRDAFNRGLELLTTAHDHLADCKWSPPVWCAKQQNHQQGPNGDDNSEDHSSHTLVCYGAAETRLLDDEEARRLLWYASFIDPLYHEFQLLQSRAAPDDVEKVVSSKRRPGKKSNRSIITKLLVDELKRPIRDADSVERIVRAADDFIQLVNAGCDVSATMILLSEIRIVYIPEEDSFQCYMHGRKVDSCTEDDPVWQHAMEFRLLCSKVMMRVGPLWRASLCLSIARELVRGLRSEISGDGNASTIQYAIEGDIIDESQDECRQGIIERYDMFATAMQQIGLIGIWNEKPIADGDVIRTKYLTGIPPGPAFRDVMEEQINWMTSHPGNNVDALMQHLMTAFPDYVDAKVAEKKD